MNKVILRFVNQQLLHCTSREYSSLSHYSMDMYFHPVTYCGSLRILNHSPPTFSEQDLFIKVAKKNIIQFSVIKFNFQRLKTMSSRKHGMFFLGENRLPWNMIKLNSKVRLKLIKAKYKAYTFAMFYSATDTKLAGDFSQIIELFLHHLGTSIINLQTSVPFGVTVLVYYIYTDVYSDITTDISFISSSQTHLRIHDGPGPLSNVICDCEEIMKFGTDDL